MGGVCHNFYEIRHKCVCENVTRKFVESGMNLGKMTNLMCRIIILMIILSMAELVKINLLAGHFRIFVSWQLWKVLLVYWSYIWIFIVNFEWRQQTCAEYDHTNDHWPFLFRPFKVVHECECKNTALRMSNNISWTYNRLIDNRCN